MVMDNKETAVSFRCPSCGSWVTGITGLFSLTADMLRLKCPCGGGEMDIVYTKDKKVRLNVPCFVCPKPHSYTLSPNVFFSRELFSLSCPYSGVDLCYTGDENEVKTASEEADEALHALFEKAGCENYFEEKRAGEKENEEIFSDPQILEIVNFVIRDLDEAGEIKCRCESDEGLYTVEVTSDGVRVKCENCGASKLIPVTSTITAQAFLNCDRLELE